MVAEQSNPDPQPEFEHFPNSPMVEAVLEFRGSPLNPWTKERLQPVLEQLAPDYPKQDDVRDLSLAFGIMFNPPSGAPPVPGSISNSNEWIGMRLASVDGLKIVTLTKASFSFSHLKPYPGWSVFVAEAMRLWELHQAVANIGTIDRLAFRSINKFPVPMGANLAHYFNGLGDLPAGLELGTSHFFYRNLLSDATREYLVNVVRTFVQPTVTPVESIELLLDIDTSTTSFGVGLATIASKLVGIRRIKNAIFQGFLTDRARQAFR